MKPPPTPFGKFGKISFRHGVGAAANARRQLPALLTAYFAEVRRVLAAHPAPPELHAIRLASKKVRYTLELFRPCYGFGLEQRLKTLKQLQQVLGEINDCVASERLIASAARPSAVRRRMEAFLRHRAQTKAAQLRRQWADGFDAPGREDWWIGYLAHNAKAPRAKKA